MGGKGVREVLEYRGILCSSTRDYFLKSLIPRLDARSESPKDSGHLTGEGKRVSYVEYYRNLLLRGDDHKLSLAIDMRRIR